MKMNVRTLTAPLEFVCGARKQRLCQRAAREMCAFGVNARAFRALVAAFMVTHVPI
jgi:hypothetical protein